MHNKILRKPTASEHHLAMSDLIGAHEAHMRAQGLSERTITARVELLWRLHHHLPYGLAYAATPELEAFLAQAGLTDRERRWSRWTRATYAMHIRGFYRWAAGKVLDGDPTADMARPRGPKCLPNPVTDDELAAALARSGEPWHTAILLAAYAGLRAHEIARLTRADITEDAIRVRGKGDNPEIIDTHPYLWAALRDRPPGPVVTHDGHPVTAKWISAHARHHFDAIGLPAVHMHRFRHWFGTTLLDCGASTRTAQKALRHASVMSTEIYTEVRSGQRRLAIRSLPAPTQTPAGNPGDYQA